MVTSHYNNGSECLHVKGKCNVGGSITKWVFDRIFEWSRDGDLLTLPEKKYLFTFSHISNKKSPFYEYVILFILNFSMSFTLQLIGCKPDMFLFAHDRWPLLSPSLYKRSGEYTQIEDNDRKLIHWRVRAVTGVCTKHEASLVEEAARQRWSVRIRLACKSKGISGG